MPSIYEMHPKRRYYLANLFWPQAGFEPALRGAWDKPSTTEPWTLGVLDTKRIKLIDCGHCRPMKMLPWPWFRGAVSVLKRKLYLKTKQKQHKEYRTNKKSIVEIMTFIFDTAFPLTHWIHHSNWFRVEEKMLLVGVSSHRKPHEGCFFLKIRLFKVFVSIYQPIPWIREVFSWLGNACNRFLA